jgi:formylmethanofuran dehydrogenase subunit D
MKRSSLFHDNSSFTAPVFNLLSPNFKKITTRSRKFHIFCIWIKTADVKAQGSKEGDRVMAYNDRGKVVMPAYATSKISDHQQS